MNRKEWIEATGNGDSKCIEVQTLTLRCRMSDVAWLANNCAINDDPRIDKHNAEYNRLKALVDQMVSSYEQAHGELCFTQKVRASTQVVDLFSGWDREMLMTPFDKLPEFEASRKKAA